LPPIGVASISADGEYCFPGTASPTPLHEALAWSYHWPAMGTLGMPSPAPCSRVGALLRICFFEGGCAETRWQGSSVIVDLEVRDRPNVIEQPPGVVTTFETGVVTARYVKDGKSVTVTPTNWVYESGGEVCSDESRLYNPSPPPITSASRFWPRDPFLLLSDRPDHPCVAHGSLVRALFTTEEYGVGEGTFVWSGSDVTFDVIFGSPAASPAVAALPNTGSHNGNAGEAFPMALAGVSVLAFGFGGLILFWRRWGRHAHP